MPLCVATCTTRSAGTPQAGKTLAGTPANPTVWQIQKVAGKWTPVHFQQLPQTEAQECHDNAAAMSGELARAYHSESAKTKNPETLAYAEKLYKVYLDVANLNKDMAVPEWKVAVPGSTQLS